MVNVVLAIFHCLSQNVQTQPQTQRYYVHLLIWVLNTSYVNINGKQLNLVNLCKRLSKIEKNENECKLQLLGNT